MAANLARAARGELAAKQARAREQSQQQRAPPVCFILATVVRQEEPGAFRGALRAAQQLPHRERVLATAHGNEHAALPRRIRKLGRVAASRRLRAGGGQRLAVRRGAARAERPRRGVALHNDGIRKLQVVQLEELAQACVVRMRPEGALRWREMRCAHEDAARRQTHPEPRQRRHANRESSCGGAARHCLPRKRDVHRGGEARHCHARARVAVAEVEIDAAGGSVDGKLVEAEHAVAQPAVAALLAVAALRVSSVASALLRWPLQQRSERMRPCASRCACLAEQAAAEAALIAGGAGCAVALRAAGHHGGVAHALAGGADGAALTAATCLRRRQNSRPELPCAQLGALRCREMADPGGPANATSPNAPSQRLCRSLVPPLPALKNGGMAANPCALSAHARSQPWRRLS